MPDELEAEMMAAADALEFERAAALRDRITQLRDSIGLRMDEVREVAQPKRRGRRGGSGRGRVPRPKKRGNK